MRVSYSLVVYICLGATRVGARSWKDIIDPMELVTHDPNERRYTLEQDPFYFGSEAPTPSPVTAGPSSSPSEQASHHPTIAHSAAPSEAPSLAPTGRWQLVDENGGCPVGEELHELRLHDSWGDGWHGSTLIVKRLQTIITNADQLHNDTSVDRNTTFTDSISLGSNSSHTIEEQEADLEESSEKVVFEGALESGSDAYSYLCLETFKCYSVEVGGGLWEDEIKWEVKRVPLGIRPETRRSSSEYSIAKGKAPALCHFAVIDQDSGYLACPFQCFDENGNSIYEVLDPADDVSKEVNVTLPSETSETSATAASSTSTQASTTNLGV